MAAAALGEADGLGETSMSATRPNPPSPARVDIVIPVLNEAHVLEASVAKIRRFAERNLPYRWQVVVADNGSTDGTWELAQSLAQKDERVRAVHLKQRGRGRALRLAWTDSDADACCYMDVDISTDLQHLPPLLAGVLEEGCGVATGSRLLRLSQVERSAKRELISRCYNLFVRLALSTTFSDAQCGFKAVSRRVIEEIVPRIEDENWFFDTELLVLAERNGHKIKDIPVKWNEDADSRVKIVQTVWEDIQGVFRLRRTLARAHRDSEQDPVPPTEAPPIEATRRRRS